MSQQALTRPSLLQNGCWSAWYGSALLDSEASAVVRTPATLLGVRHLGYAGQLVEIECTAALPLNPLGHQPG